MPGPCEDEEALLPKKASPKAATASPKSSRRVKTASGTRRQYVRFQLLIRNTILSVAVLVIVAAAVSILRRLSKESPAGGGSTSSKPHIFISVIDDLGMNDIGYSEETEIAAASPFLTSAAQSGIILSHYYSHMQCTPARATLLTGRYATTIGAMSCQALLLLSRASPVICHV